jgi:hypothetical protein
MSVQYDVRLKLESDLFEFESFVLESKQESLTLLSRGVRVMSSTAVTWGESHVFH